jgi:hypothetical protein
MRTKTSILTLSLFSFVLISGFAHGFQVNISGTWIGETEIPNQGTDELTLVLEKANGGYTATISDSFGMLMDAECEDLKYENNTLSFNINIFDGYSDMTVFISLKVEGSTMTGYWETEEGQTGEITMEKQTQ